MSLRSRDRCNCRVLLPIGSLCSNRWDWDRNRLEEQEHRVLYRAFCLLFVRVNTVRSCKAEREIAFHSPVGLFAFAHNAKCWCFGRDAIPLRTFFPFLPKFLRNRSRWWTHFEDRTLPLDPPKGHSPFAHSLLWWACDSGWSDRWWLNSSVLPIAYLLAPICAACSASVHTLNSYCLTYQMREL